MRYLALVTDFGGTLTAHDGLSAESALERLRVSGRRIVLAAETARLEHRGDIEPWQTREIICNLVDARYTLPE